MPNLGRLRRPQASALSAERSSLDILNRQLLATVGLVKALGGGDWQ